MKLLAILAPTLALGAACSVWAAIDDPYKPDSPGASHEAGSGPADAGVDVGADVAQGPDAGRRAGHEIEGGFTPYALTAYNDSIYALDDQARVHVARDGGTTFELFWVGDGGDGLTITRNAVAASGAGVFWTVGGGVRYCALDGGSCGFMASAIAAAIAASDPVVAWVDGAGVRVCPTPCSSIPLPLPGSKSAQRVAVSSSGEVAWTDGGTRVYLGTEGGSVALATEANFLATDRASDKLYYISQAGVGFIEFDGGSGPRAPLTITTKITDFYADHGKAFWSVRTTGKIESCQLEQNAACSSATYDTGLPYVYLASFGVAATARSLVAIFGSDTGQALPVLVGWRVP